jgi:hypothetical protein
MAELTDTNHMDQGVDLDPAAPDTLPNHDGVRPSSWLIDTISALPRLELALIITLVFWMLI